MTSRCTKLCPNDTRISDVPYAIDSNLTEVDTGRIEREYMDSRFEKYLKALNLGDENEKVKTLDDLHKSFAALTQEEQKYAALFLHDIQRGGEWLYQIKQLKVSLTTLIVELLPLTTTDSIICLCNTTGKKVNTETFERECRL